MNWRMPFTTHTKHQLAQGQQPQRTKLVPVKTWQRTQILAEGIAHPLLSKQWDLHKLQDRTYFLKTRNKYLIHYGLELNKKFLLGRLLDCFLQDLLHFLQKQMVPLASAATRLLGGRDWGSEKRGREAGSCLLVRERVQAQAGCVKCLLNPEHRCAWSWQRDNWIFFSAPLWTHGPKVRGGGGGRGRPGKRSKFSSNLC